jgi:hypothetical protein
MGQFKTINVNSHVIKSNRKNNKRDPVITVKYKNGKGKNFYTNEALLIDANGQIVAKVIYDPDQPLKCGAVCWIETDCLVT